MCLNSSGTTCSTDSTPEATASLHYAPAAVPVPVSTGWKTTRRLLERYVGGSAHDQDKQKRARKMDALKKIFLHAEKVYATGHTILGAALVFRGVVKPFRLTA